MADAAPVEGGGGDGEKAGGMDHGEEESRMKLCFFACLDCIATVVRWCVTAWNGFKWVLRRVTYPIKEAGLSCVDCCTRWYRPFKTKRPQGASVPSFGYGHGVPDFQY
uniref:Uncharacterized protein n=1 Tax=Alexandrium andersonii TaxID=327968 RepID=A0A7S2BPP2_9DINO|mmetsp:Transcript_28315/g.64259  ORF Transcript_28315/g.64259 Transcript_28315/m.64259 type:complete len:108 (+) Transcript_28315:132-455(+)